MALAASFALSVGIFNTTYAAQARIDAQLTNGADVAVTTAAATGLPANLAATVRGLPGVVAAEPMQHRFALRKQRFVQDSGTASIWLRSATCHSDVEPPSFRRRAAAVLAWPS